MRPKHAAKSKSAAAPAPVAPPPPPPRPDPASLKIVLYPAPVLKRRAADVVQIDDWLRAVVEKMKQLMVQEAGVGLAAPQVGIGLRFFVWSPNGKAEEARAFINPVLSAEQGQVEGEEGCLSLPDIRAKIHRYQSLHIEGLDENGQPVALDLVDYPARIVQHENDHLDGILILDRMSPLAKLSNRRKIKSLEDAAPRKKA